MKKLLLTAAIVAFGLSSAQTGLKLGAHLGIPVGDAHESYSFLIGADVFYLHPVSDLFSIGAATGYSHYFGKEYTIPLNPAFGGPSSMHVSATDINLVPLAVSTQFMVSPNFSLGADLGAGFMFALGDSVTGFYYRPNAAYHFGKHEINFSYMGVSKYGNAGALTLGYAYSLTKL